MNSIEFVNNYHMYLEEISQVVKPEYQLGIEELGQIDPHDLVTPDTWFNDENSTKGLVWKLFLLKAKEKEKTINGGN